MRTRCSFFFSAPLIAASIVAAVGATPTAIRAQQGQEPGQITAGPAKAANPPTLATMSRFTGTWSCSIAPVATSSFIVRGMPSSQGGAFVLQSPTTVTHFTSSAGSLQFTRTSTAGGTVNYTLSSYAPHGTDLVFQEANPSAHGGSAPGNTFTPTFEIKRDAKYLVVTTNSPKFGTIDYSCSRS